MNSKLNYRGVAKRRRRQQPLAESILLGDPVNFPPSHLVELKEKKQKKQKKFAMQFRMQIQPNAEREEP